MIKTALTALLVGGIFGFTVAIFDLPTPAPPSVAGLLGIVGIFAGYKLGQPAAEFIATLL